MRFQYHLFCVYIWNSVEALLETGFRHVGIVSKHSVLLLLVFLAFILRSSLTDILGERRSVFLIQLGEESGNTSLLPGQLITNESPWFVVWCSLYHPTRASVCSPATLRLQLSLWEQREREPKKPTLWSAATDLLKNLSGEGRIQMTRVKLKENRPSKWLSSPWKRKWITLRQIAPFSFSLNF